VRLGVILRLNGFEPHFKQCSLSKICFASPPLARPKAKSCQIELGVVPARVVTLDEIRIVSIHHPDEVSEFCRRFWMEAAPQVVRLSLQFHREVRQDGRYGVLEEARLDPSRCFILFLPILKIHNCL
jgi:hypothetical protein